MHLRFTAVVFVIAIATANFAKAQQVGSCETGEAEAFLDANDVRAAVYNAGNLFWRGSGNVYTVPKQGDANAIFVAEVWLGGMVEGELRFAGTDYGPFEFFPGPLTESGELPSPSDCSPYDRIFEVNRVDLDRLDETGETTDDIRDWPWQFAAPVRDGDGNPNNYDLAGGDRPDLTGHQMLWWVMNDLGGTHLWGQAPPLGVEIQSSAFAVLSDDPALHQSTFYRYLVTNKQSYVIDSTYFGLMVDADVGNAVDDFIGTDTTLGMGYFYNGDNDDDDPVGYGHAPPAVGLDFVQGPLAPADGIDNDRDGQVDENGERLRLTASLYPDAFYPGNPRDAHDAYGYLKAVWPNGNPQTLGGTGYGGDDRSMFTFPGDPVTRSYWSEVNTDGSGSRNTPADRHFVISTGPFRLDPGETEEIVFAVVWARGDDHLDSVAKLREADRAVQDAWDSSQLEEIPMPALPTDPPIPVSPADGVQDQPTNVTLHWSPISYVSEYRVEIDTSPTFDGPGRRVLTTRTPTIEVDSLLSFDEYYWRVRGESAIFISEWSPASSFGTSNIHFTEVGLQTIPGSNSPAFLEISGPGGVDPCDPDAASTLGCSEAGGNLVYGSYNSTGEYVMYHMGAGPEESIGEFAPHDFDIRFTAEGSYAIHPFTSHRIIWVPFEVWDVGPGGIFEENDPADDVRLIPAVFSDAEGDCAFGYGEGDDPFGLGWEISDRIYAYYAKTSYADWAATVGPLVENAEERCYQGTHDLTEVIDFDRGRPIQRIIFAGDPAVHNHPGEGTIVRFYTTPDTSLSPILAAPHSGSGPHEQPLTLYWNAQRGVHVTSQLQISAESAFDNPVVDVTTAEESFTVSGLDEGRTYHWRSRLTRPEGPWSDIWTFTAGQVTNIDTELDNELPKELTLRPNYPNPFNPTTTIRFGLPQAGPVRLVVYDLLGRRVATLVDENTGAGWHEVSWDASRLASGTYLYEIATEHGRQTNTMVLLR